ncbi:acid phosphatase [Pigmentiphaga soli]
MAIAMAGGLFGCGNDDDSTASAPPPQQDQTAAAVNDIQNVVVIFAENRSFDNLYSDFPGVASPLAKAAYPAQVNRDGTTQLTSLPKIWGGLTSATDADPTVSGASPIPQFDTGVPMVTAAETEGMPNAPFAINEVYQGVGLTAVNHDLWHNFYQNQMQIDGGKNDMFAAWADDAGGLVMGHFSGDAQSLPLWKVAQKYTLADNFFMGAFGGSFLNHQFLIAAAAPVDKLDTDARKALVAHLTDGDTGYHLKVKAADPTTLPTPMDAMTISANTIFENAGTITPDGYDINTMQPPYQPSGNKPATGATGNALLLADPGNAKTVSPQTGPTIGDYLSQKNVEWAWYSGGWDYALARDTDPTGWKGGDPYGVAYSDNGTPYPNFQTHHQPFNYFKRFDPTTQAGQAERVEHLKDAGVQGEKFVSDIDRGQLPPVAFYKPVGYLNEHNGYANVKLGDDHIADIISHLEKSPQWAHMLVIVTYDENGGLWDHVAPPKGDRFGPGSRIPAIIVGPTVRKGCVDHTMYDTTSILRFITRRWDLDTLPGLQTRIDALAKNNDGVSQGDLSNVLAPAQVDSKLMTCGATS